MIVIATDDVASRLEVISRGLLLVQPLTRPSKTSRVDKDESACIRTWGRESVLTPYFALAGLIALLAEYHNCQYERRFSRCTRFPLARSDLPSSVQNVGNELLPAVPSQRGAPRIPVFRRTVGQDSSTSHITCMLTLRIAPQFDQPRADPSLLERLFLSRLTSARARSWESRARATESRVYSSCEEAHKSFSPITIRRKSRCWFSVRLV